MIRIFIIVVVRRMFQKRRGSWSCIPKRVTIFRKIPKFRNLQKIRNLPKFRNLPKNSEPSKKIRKASEIFGDLEMFPDFRNFVRKGSHTDSNFKYHHHIHLGVRTKQLNSIKYFIRNRRMNEH